MDTQPPLLVSQADIARHASVGRAAVANWRSRHKEFPRPFDEAAQLFDAKEVALWLDGRRIPMSALGSGEIEGVSYGTRFRRSLGLMAQPWSRTARRNDVVRLLDHVPAISLGEHHLRLLASLIYIRGRSPTTWAHLMSGNVHLEQVADAYRRTLPPDAPAAARNFADIHQSEIGLALISDSLRRVDLAFIGDAADSVLVADLLSELIDEYADKAGAKAAESFTPHSVTRLAISLLQPSRSTQRIYDPYCRAGEFLAETSRYLEESRPGVRVKAYGLHPDSHMCTLTWMVATARGAEAEVDQGYWWSQPYHKTEFDLIFSNPPFNLPVPSELREERYWRYGTPPEHNSNFGWIQHVLTQLSADGRAALILPNNAGFTSNSREKAIRRELVEDGVVDAVIALPGRLFRGTDIPVAMWLLSGPHPRTTVLLVDASSEVSKPSRGRRVLDQRTIERISRTYLLYRQGQSEPVDGFARAVSIAELRADDYRLHPTRWIQPAVAERTGAEDPLGVLDQHTRALLSRLHGAREHASFALKPTGGGLNEPWPIAVLADLCDVKSGPSGGKVRPDPESTGQVPVLLPRHLGRGPIRHDGAPSIPAATAESLAEYRLRSGDIVFARVGGLGRVALITDAENGWLMSAGLVRLRPNERIASSYLAHVLRSPAGRGWISRRAGGSFVPTLNIADLRQLPVRVPPLDEQHRVALLLDAIAEQADAARELIEAAAEAIDSVASTYFGVDTRQ